MEKLLEGKLLYNKTVVIPCKPVYAESCGCVKSDKRLYQKQHYTVQAAVV